MAIQNQRLNALVEDFRGRAIAVVGDLMLDEFTWGQVRRISPEAPVPVVEVERRTYRPGGSANVAANIKALGGEPLAVGLVGCDDAGSQLTGLLNELGIDSRMLVEGDRATTLKTRIIAHGQQIVRTDREDRSTPEPMVIDALLRQFSRALTEAEAVVVSDYDKGVVNAELLARILPAAERSRTPVFLDPKVHHADYYRPVTMLTPNRLEAELMSGVAIRNAQSLADAGRKLLERFDCPYVLITQGEEGMSLFERGAVHHIPACALEVFDVTGAGDTVIATMALGRAAGATMEEAAWLANYAAGVVVGKVGTAVLTHVELADAIRSHSG